MGSVWMIPSGKENAINPITKQPVGSLTGHTLAGFRLEGLLGHGGMAEVYLGRRQGVDRTVAIKVLFAHLRDDPMLMEMLQSEAAALTAMRHPNIVQYLDCNVIQGRPYIIMDLPEGIALEERLAYSKKHGLLPPLNVVERVFRSAASALDYAHAQGIVHRDIKPLPKAPSGVLPKHQAQSSRFLSRGRLQGKLQGLSRNAHPRSWSEWCGQRHTELVEPGGGRVKQDGRSQSP